MSYGAIKSPKDERDYKYSNVKRTVNVKLPKPNFHLMILLRSSKK